MTDNTWTCNISTDDGIEIFLTANNEAEIDWLATRAIDELVGDHDYVIAFEPKHYFAPLF